MVLVAYLVVLVLGNFTFADACPTGALFCIPLSIQNTQNQPINVGTQFAIVFNAIPNNSSIDENLSNICVANNKMCITAWIQSMPSNQLSNNRIWIKSPTTIGAHSTYNGLAMAIFANTINEYSNSSILGASPTDYCPSGCPTDHYAGVDNGGLIFDEYDNFLGSSIPYNQNTVIDAMWNFYSNTNSGYWTVNNGLIINAGMGGSIISSVKRFNSSTDETVDTGMLIMGYRTSYPCCGFGSGMQTLTSGFYYMNADSSINSIDLGDIEISPKWAGGLYRWFLPDTAITIEGGTNTIIIPYGTTTSVVASETDRFGRFSIFTDYGFGRPIFNNASYSTHDDRFAQWVGLWIYSDGVGNAHYDPQNGGAQYIMMRKSLPNDYQPVTLQPVTLQPPDNLYINPNSLNQNATSIPFYNGAISFNTVAYDGFPTVSGYNEEWLFYNQTNELAFKVDFNTTPYGGMAIDKSINVSVLVFPNFITIYYGQQGIYYQNFSGFYLPYSLLGNWNVSVVVSDTGKSVQSSNTLFSIATIGCINCTTPSTTSTTTVGGVPIVGFTTTTIQPTTTIVQNKTQYCLTNQADNSTCITVIKPPLTCKTQAESSSILAGIQGFFNWQVEIAGVPMLSMWMILTGAAGLLTVGLYYKKNMGYQRSMTGVAVVAMLFLMLPLITGCVY